MLLSDQLMDDEEDNEIYEMDERDDDDDEEEEVVIPGTSERFSDEMDSFYLNEDEDEDSAIDLVQENPFEPVYPATAAGMLFDENSSGRSVTKIITCIGKGMVLEAVSLDNILPAGSRRRHNNNNNT